MLYWLKKICQDQSSLTDNQVQVFGEHKFININAILILFGIYIFVDFSTYFFIQQGCNITYTKIHQFLTDYTSTKEAIVCVVLLVQFIKYKYITTHKYWNQSQESPKCFCATENQTREHILQRFPLWV